MNGQSIHNIKDLPGALKKVSGGFHVFRFEGNDDPLILDAQLTAKADTEILAQYGIPAPAHITNEETHL